MTKEKIEYISQAAADRGYVEFEKAFNDNLAKYSNYGKGYGESLAIKESLSVMLNAAISTAITGLLEELGS